MSGVITFSDVRHPMHAHRKARAARAKGLRSAKLGTQLRSSLEEYGYTKLSGNCRRYLAFLDRPQRLDLQEITDRLCKEIGASDPIPLARIVSMVLLDHYAANPPRVDLGGSETVPDVSTIGTRLHEIINREVGAIECGECRQQITRLNSMTTDQVHADRESIAAGIVDRAKTRAPRFWQRWGATLAPGIAAAQVIEWIEEALGPS